MLAQTDEKMPVAVDEPTPLPPERPEPDNLDPEMNLFDEAKFAAQDGNLDDALRLYGRYLNGYPQGRMTDEAELSTLKILAEMGHHREVAVLASRLAANPDLSDRRGQLLHVQAQALAALGECDEALAIADTLDRKLVSDVRKVCRK